MSHFNEASFRAKVDKALEVVTRVLENNRHPQYPDEVQHKYEDKYLLAEFVTNTSLAAQLNCLEILGLSEADVKKMRGWVAKRAVTVRLSAEERCTFVRETTRKVESKTEHVTEVSTGFGKVSRSDKVVSKVTEYFWKYTWQWELDAYAGGEKVTLRKGDGETEVMTTSKSSPYPKVRVVPVMEVNITWLLQHLSDALTLNFGIDRSATSCHTPRRNSDIGGAMTYFSSFKGWANSVARYFENIFTVQQKHELDLGQINAHGVFVPVTPFFDEEGTSGSSDETASSPVLSIGDLNLFLAEQQRSLEEKFGALRKTFPEKGQLITVPVATAVVVMKHAQEITDQFVVCIEYIEHMLYSQLEAAIGKVVKPVDFANYMRFHCRKLFRREFEPVPFSYAVRRPDHYPEGIVSIDAQLSDGSTSQPIESIVKHSEWGAPMFFPINASTNIEFCGDRYVHAWMRHQFASDTAATLSLNARARQFSSFIMMVGRIVGPDAFDPQAAIIVKNKDDLNIPLDFETIPTPKEFADAIESLSPEQQRFCKAFRSMQLESTLFGIVVVQIKPQLEKVLNLPDDALTKEIRLTEDLMELFIEYQIPSDLLSYEDAASAPVYAKLAAVKKHVAAMQEMIGAKKDTELSEELQRQDYFLAENDIDAEEFRDKQKEKDVKEKVKKKKKKKSKERRRKAPMAEGDIAPTSSKTGSATQGGESTTGGDAPGDSKEYGMEESAAEDGVVDYTQIPVELDQKFSELDVDNAIRPTIVHAGKVWSRKAYRSLLADAHSESLQAAQHVTEKKKAFDLLDSLTKSGALSLARASLHVVIAATHVFDKSLVDTVIQDNVNPIEKVERSLLIVATTVHGQSASALVKEDQLERVSTYSSNLFDSAGE